MVFSEHRVSQVTVCLQNTPLVFSILDQSNPLAETDRRVKDAVSVAAFYQNGRKKVECKLCKKQFAHHSSTTSMAYHLKTVS